MASREQQKMNRHAAQGGVKRKQNGIRFPGKSMEEMGIKQNEKTMRNSLRKYLSGKVRNCLTKVGTGDIVSSC